jgi:hypothetical protein
MNNTCMNLELNRSHPAVIGNRSISSDAITLFRKGRATFIHDPVARDRASRKLEKAARLVNLSIQRFDLMKSIKGLLSENSPPPVGHTIRDQTGSARWVYGMTRSDKAAVAPKAGAWRVRLANGLEAQECLLTAKSKSRICTQTDEFCFISRATRICHDIGENRYSLDDQVTIVGFSLTCNNAWNVPVEFTITRGGILSSSLSIDVSIPRGCEWHCRVFFVNGELS